MRIKNLLYIPLGYLIVLEALILADMFILKGYLKDFFVRANTSDISPFSTDGQSNYILILLILVIIFILVRLLWGKSKT